LPGKAASRLKQVWPQPATAEVRFLVSGNGVVAPGSLDLFDLSGRRVATVFEGYLPSGDLTVTWDGRIDRGERAPPGVYLARLAGNGRIDAVRVLVLD
jgi:hypothetical protein